MEWASGWKFQDGRCAKDNRGKANSEMDLDIQGLSHEVYFLIICISLNVGFKLRQKNNPLNTRFRIPDNLSKKKASEKNIYLGVTCFENVYEKLVFFMFES